MLESVWFVGIKNKIQTNNRAKEARADPNVMERSIMTITANQSGRNVMFTLLNNIFISENWNNWKDSLNFDELAATVAEKED